MLPVNSQGEIRRFRNSEKLRKHETSSFSRISAARIQRETGFLDHGYKHICFRSVYVRVNITDSYCFISDIFCKNSRPAQTTIDRLMFLPLLAGG